MLSSFSFRLRRANRVVKGEVFITLEMAAEIAADDVLYKRISDGYRCPVNALLTCPKIWS